MTNHSHTLYAGVTNNLPRWVQEHKLGEQSGFAKKQRLAKLVWFEETGSVQAAVAREKRIRG